MLDFEDIFTGLAKGFIVSAIFAIAYGMEPFICYLMGIPFTPTL